jgi:hypothetical protein
LLIARLCEADLRGRGLSASAVLYGGNQIAADGGIDVRVELAADTDISGFIPRPVTGFQAKADDMPASEIEKEMRPKNKQADGTRARRLRPSIRTLAEAGGAYVIVSSKGSTTDSRLTERRDAIRAAVADLDWRKYGDGPRFLLISDLPRVAGQAPAGHPFPRRSSGPLLPQNLGPKASAE